MDKLTVMGCLEGLAQDDWQQWYSDSEVQETAKAALTLLEEIPLRCKKCSYHREDGLCNMHKLYVEDTDYCSLGAWKGQ